MQNHPIDASPSRTRLRRRDFIRLAGPFTLLLAAGPAYAFKLFDIIDPEKKSKDLQRTRQVLEGVTGITQSVEGIDYQSEFTIGETLALEGFQRYGQPVKDQRLQQYVNLLGNTAARNSLRPDIPYYFVVVDSPLYNAFACPGGIIFLSSSLVNGMSDEAELACVLAHEVGHVAHKHALQSIQRARFFEGAAKIGTVGMRGEQGQKYREMVGDLQTVLFDKGLDRNMEFEADRSGMDFAYRTGYDPGGMIRVLEMLVRQQTTATHKGSWFSTHPPLSERIARCTAAMADYPDAAEMATARNRFLSHRDPS
jgi:beta-barrel assembly-enhancing protease